MAKVEAGAAGLISGGLDSTVVAAYMNATYEQNYFLFCDYGQKTLERERRAFDDLCEHYIPTGAQVVDMRWLRQVGNSGLFEEETRLNPTNKQREYVPFRNASMLCAAVALAETVEAKAVLIGSTGGDRVCPDNSKAFMDAFQRTMDEGTMTESTISLVTPLIELDKKGVISLGLSLDAPFHLSWSCHNNVGREACGQCTNCIARRKAFTELGQKDPVPYETAEE